jgi:CMP-N,N'-diacetyllegionaminic acid synthase
MIDDRHVLVVVPARGGSKGVPGKNLREIGGVSLLHRTIRSAMVSRYVDLVVVSSDDETILEHARLIDGVVALKRPSDLATDESAMWPVVEHALSENAADIVVLLQPTSPLRDTADIDGALEKFIANEANSLVSVCSARTSPYWMYRLSDDDLLQPVLAKPDVATRQELPPTYQVNGAVYIVDAEWFGDRHVFVDDETIAYVMPTSRSIDVDTEADLVVAEALLTWAEPLTTPTDK